jgi:hypothetical protein
MIEIKFIFETIEEAYEFLNKKTELQQQTKPKKENDGRGKNTKQFHELCKIYHNDHPDKTYRECLKELSNLNKNKIDI